MKVYVLSGDTTPWIKGIYTSYEAAYSAGKEFCPGWPKGTGTYFAFQIDELELFEH